MLTRYLRLFALAAWALSIPAGAHHVGDSASSNATGAFAAEVSLSGIVDDLVVVDRVNGKTQHYPILRQANGDRVALRGDAISAVMAGAQVTVAGGQTGPAFTVTRVDAQSLSDKAAPAAMAASSRVNGEFMVAHADNFATGTSRFIYQVNDAAGGATEIAMPFLPSVLASGMQVTVDGNVAADGSIVADTITIDAIPDVLPAAATTSYLVIPIKFPISGAGTVASPWVYNADPFLVTALNSAVFGSLPAYHSVKEFYNEVSYGQQLLSGITADNGSGGFLLANVATPPCSNYTAIGTAADNAAKARGYNLTSYTGILYVFNGVPSCGWSGLAYVGYARAWSNNTTNVGVIGHELGHNFGLLHAGSLNCAGTTIGCGASGSVAEYGDPFSTMGNSGHVGHFNAAQKSILGWFGASAVKTHTSGTATYTLSPIETAGQPVYAVKIPSSNSNRTYWIEYRQPTGAFDTFIVPPSYPNAGAQIRIEYPFEAASGSDDTEILDLTPATAGNFNDAALLAGAPTFVDGSTSVSISVVSATPGATGLLTVQVSTVAGTATTTTLANSLNPSNFGGSVTFTASVTGVAPTGAVNFKDGATSIAGCSAVALAGSGNTRSASCSTSGLTGGTHSVAAIYGGDATNLASSSVALSQVVSKAATSTSLASSVNPSIVGASVTFTASVTGVAPTGSVNFKDGATSICSAVALTGSGNTRTATCTTSTLTAATHSMTAAYGGDTGNNASASATLSQVVNAGTTATTTTMASSLNPSIFGASVTFTASVTGVAPTGAVNFKDGATSITGCSAIALTGIGNTRTATCTTAGLTAATHSVTAGYGGNAGNKASTSAALSQVVNKAATSTSLASSANPSIVGTSVTFTASVTGVAPTGAVNFKDGATSITGCSAVALTGSGNTRTATCTTSTFTAGTHSMTVAYGGDASNNASASTTLSQVVNAGTSATTTTVASSLNPSIFGASVTFTASVTGVAPTGAVNFKDGATSIAGCSAVALIGSGNTRTAACTTTSLSVATHSIVAVYSGNAGNLTSTSSTLSQVVNAGSGGSTTNVALAANGGVASASSTYAFGTYPVASIIDGERAGINWGASGGWEDGTGWVFPDWAQVNFSGQKTIDHVVVYSLQDNFPRVDPSNTMTFTQYGLTDFQVQGWNGASWVTLGSVAGNNLVKRTVNFAATTTDRIRVNVTGAMMGYSRIVEVEAWTTSGATAAPTTTTVASSVNPSSVGTSVTFTAAVTGVAPTGTVNFTDGGISIAGCAAVALTGSGNTRNSTCSTSTLAAGTRTVAAGYAGDAGNLNSTSTPLSQVVSGGAGPTSTTVVSSLNPSLPGASVTFTASITGTAPTGTVSFKDDATSITGCSAVALTGSGDTRSAACTTAGLATATHSIVASYGGDSGNLASTSGTLSQVVSSGGGGPATNVALAANGGIASASSTYAGSFGASYPAATVIDGERAGASWGSNGGWMDNTSGIFPDWVQVNFSGQKTIDHVVVYSLQDNFPRVDPSNTLTFSSYGVTAFQVQGWNGASWVTLGSVAGNNLVKRTVNFTATTTDRIRVNVTGALASYSRIVEVEAWGN